MSVILSIVINEGLAFLVLFAIVLIVYLIYSKLKASIEMQRNLSERIRNIIEEQKIENIRGEARIKEFQNDLENKIKQKTHSDYTSKMNMIYLFQKRKQILRMIIRIGR